MVPFRLPTLATCAALALMVGAPGAVRADADDGMCVVVHQAAFEVGVLASVDPAELETADPHAAPAEHAPTEGHLLCASADDPRCAPLSAEDTPESPELPARASVVLFDGPSLSPRPLRPVAFGPPSLLGPATGPSTRTYRPPRG